MKIRMTYENLLIEAENEGVNVKEIDCKTNKKYGRCIDNFIFINSNMTSVEKREILAEELAHYRKTHGNILNQSIVSNKKQEIIARRESYDILLNPKDIIKAMEVSTNLYEMAQYLNITEKTLTDILDDYRKRFGIGIKVDNYYLVLEPTLGIIKDCGGLFKIV